MSHDEIVSYLESESKMKKIEFGASSITFKHDMTFFTIFRRGKKMKDIPSSVVMYNFSVEDAVVFAEAVRIETQKNQKLSQKVVSIADRMKSKPKQKTKKEDEDENRDW